MKRLTFDGNFCDIANCREIPCPYNGACTQRLVWERLKQYEDSGLSPIACLEARKIEDGLSDHDYSIARMVELMQADKSGRAVILPCEPGTPVYMTFCGEVWEMRVGQFHVNGYTEPRIWADIDCDWASTQCVIWDLVAGKTVFLTREEAEKALEAMKDE